MADDDNKDENQSMTDFKTLIKILVKHKFWASTFIGFIMIVSATMTWLYNHFAKEEDLLKHNCIRQAVDLDTKVDIQISQHENMISVSNVILKMFSELPENSELEYWIVSWRDIKDKHTNSLNLLLKKNKNYDPLVIDKCIKSQDHIIKPNNIDTSTIFLGIGDM